MMKRRCVMLLLAAALSGCAAITGGEPDKLLIDHGGASGISIERTGVIFGSIGFAPRDLSMSAMSLHLRSVDDKGHRFEIFATNWQQHARWRTPDVDTDDQRIWVFSGRVPAGRYEIALAGLSGADAHEVHWMNFKPAIPVTVSAKGAVYLGRWQFTPAAAQLPENQEQVRIPGSDLVLRDTPDEDQALLARKRGDSPIGKRPIDDVLRDLADRS
ncbi:MAG: hypothetical protein JWQ07_790 [Ramlibacter sp.]|nr:hypothetical protein [Ramlibacter sp.]